MKRVKEGATGDPFRPQIDFDECSDEAKCLMAKCWAENPSDRPTDNQLMSGIKKLNRYCKNKTLKKKRKKKKSKNNN